MNKIFHQIAPQIALKFMSKEFVDFFICDTYTIDNLKIDCDLPDLVDHDNIENDFDIHHAHSYKLELREDGQLHWKNGDALEKLKGLCSDFHDYLLEGKIDMARYCLGKMTHYRVDSLTYPHLFFGKPWNIYHVKYEDEMGKFIKLHQNEILNIKPTPYKDIYKDCRKTSIDMWHIGKDIVDKYEKKIPLTDDDKILVCKKCVQGIVDLWSTLASELKLMKKTK